MLYRMPTLLLGMLPGVVSELMLSIGCELAKLSTCMHAVASLTTQVDVATLTFSSPGDTVGQDSLAVRCM